MVFEPDISETVTGVQIPGQCTDSLDAIIQTNKLISQLHSRGYLAAFPVNYQQKDSFFLVNIDKGQQFTWINLENGNVPEVILAEIGLNLTLMTKKPVHGEGISVLMQQILERYADLGFPFAQIKLDSLEIHGKDVSARLYLTQNKKIVFDSLEIVSKTNVSIGYLEKLLGIRPAQVFNASKVKAISQKINQLPFLSTKSAPQVLFSGNKAKVRLNLEDKKNSRFDVLIGIQQDEKKPGGVRIAGEIAAEMQNRLGQGEYFGLQYKNRAANVQELHISMQYPFLFDLPFGINAGFKLFQNGDSFRNLDFNTGLSYQLGDYSSLGIFWQSSGSRLISIDTASLLTNRKLPDQLDVSVNGLGLNYLFEKLDYRFNPRKGWKISAESVAGIKNVIPNIEIQSLKNDLVDFKHSFDTIRGGTQFSLSCQLSYFQPLGKLMTLMISNASGWKFAQNGLFRNEAFRIGGNKLLRGFDEESIFVNAYSVMTLEPRLIIGKNSWFFVFGEVAALNLKTNIATKIDFPYSLGTGLSFDTKAGVLLVSAAVGGIQGAGLDFNATRVHIGYVNLF
ncbi:MAG TPA: hypothetical protein DCQ58_04975 [Saprospirales bacterium]|nr:hypothetical protein [Saprospirales bacterium]